MRVLRAKSYRYVICFNSSTNSKFSISLNNFVCGRVMCLVAACFKTLFHESEEMCNHEAQLAVFLTHFAVKLLQYGFIFLFTSLICVFLA